MRTIEVNFNKCGDCFECETILPRFRTKYGGIMRMDESGRDEELRAAAERAKDNCPMQAIVITKHFCEHKHVV